MEGESRVRLPFCAPIRLLNPTRRGGAVPVCVAFMAALFLFASPDSAHALTAFGPETFANTGKPVGFARSFPAQNPGSAYFMRVTMSAAPGATEPGVSATIYLDGKRIFRPANFKHGTMTLLEKTVTLQAANSLRLLVDGPSGSQLTIVIMGVNTGGGGDTTPPTITAAASPAPNGAGWNNTNVTVTFACSDAGSGIATCPTPVTVTTEGANQVISGTATDNAGNSAGASVTLNIDKNRPTITAAISPLPNGAGWNNSNPTVTFTCGDSLSTIASCPAPVTVTTEGANQVISGTAADRAGNSANTSVTVNIDKTLPTITATVSPPPNGSGWDQTNPTVTFTCSDTGSGVAACTSPVTVTTEGANQLISGTVTDQAGNSASASATVNLDKTPPTVTITAPQDNAQVTSSPVSVTATVSDALSGLAGVTCNGSPATLSNGSATCQAALNAGPNPITVQASDLAGNVASSGITVAFANLPPDPSTVAPPLSRTAATSMLDATSFLYTGPNPIQTGVAPGTITLQRAAVLRGRVLDLTGQPLPGVTMTVLNHPEFGQTLSRLDGMFDLGVNGGGFLTVRYQKTGFPSTQRQINVPWQDYTMLPDVILVPYDAHANPIDLSRVCDVNMICTSHPMQVARGGVVTDANGTRQATLLVPTGTTAVMTLPDGSAVPLISLTVRATEYTVGPNGPAAMPAQLPPTSAYTYEVEFSVDEADAAGATRVTFNPPLISYTENFLNIPAGIIVPSGEYDRTKGVWMPEPNGLVIKILSITDGMANLDLDGSGNAADPTALAALGIGSDELQNLATLFAAGQTLWRVPIDHFLSLK